MTYYRFQVLGHAAATERFSQCYQKSVFSRLLGLGRLADYPPPPKSSCEPKTLDYRDFHTFTLEYSREHWKIAFGDCLAECKPSALDFENGTP